VLTKNGHGYESRFINKSRGFWRITVDELRAELNRYGVRSVDREYPAANAVARFQQYNLLPRSPQLSCRHQARGAGPNHYDIFSRGRFFQGSADYVINACCPTMALAMRVRNALEVAQ
jgi:hypothetical protein